MKHDKPALIVKTNCCGKSFQIAAIPYAYSCKSLQKDLRKYAKEPDKYTIEVTDEYEFGYCACKEITGSCF